MNGPWITVALGLAAIVGAVAAVVVLKPSSPAAASGSEPVIDDAGRVQRADEAGGEQWAHAQSEANLSSLREVLRADGALGSLIGAVDGIQHGIVVVDRSGEVIYRNDAATSLSAAPHGHALVEECVRRTLAAAQAGQETSEEVELFGPPAELFVVSAHPFADEEGTGALALVEDRSDIRRTETVRRDFVANISHELKTPIGAIGLLAETIESEQDPEVMRRLATTMVSEAERASNTIDDLLELSRIEFADDADHSEVELASVVSEAVARIATAADQRGVEVTTDVPGSLRLRGDRQQLVSALFNLLDNAVKYSRAGGRVTVLGRRSGAPEGRLELSVIDEGVGIPRRSLERVFERFYRVDRARSRNTGGTGLGLAIVRHVVSNHGGEVEVESTEGQGTEFTLRLPVTSGAGGSMLTGSDRPHVEDPSALEGRPR